MATSTTENAEVDEDGFDSFFKNSDDMEIEDNLFPVLPTITRISSPAAVAPVPPLIHIQFPAPPPAAVLSTINSNNPTTVHGPSTRQYHLPLRTDLVSHRTTDVREHLTTIVPINPTVDTDLLHIETDDIPTPKWILHGYSAHHEHMEKIVDRMHHLVKITLEQQEQHSKVSMAKVSTFANKITAVKEKKSGRWFVYVKILRDLLQKERLAMNEKFKDHMENLCRSLVLTGCIKTERDYEKELNEATQIYLLNHSIDSSFERIKHEAFREFKQKVMSKTANDNDANTNKILDHHLNKLEKEFTDPIYVGIEKEQLQLIPPLLQRAEIFCRCSTSGLPVFDSSIDILDKTAEHNVLLFSIPTGSGKSTVVPALYVAAGYKVFVTQPRRLASTTISRRVNSTMGENLSGWAVAGARSKNNRDTRILYLTDGLLREKLQLFEETLLPEIAQSSHGCVFFIDEVHERSINIDLCIAFLLAQLSENNFNGKMKIVLSSATIKPSVEDIFKRSNVGFHALQIKITTLHPIQRHLHSNENMFDLIERLHKLCIGAEQILCFVKSTGDVTSSISLLEQKKKLKAYPLVESQSANVQQGLIAEQRIFFSTTVAQTSLTFPSLRFVIDTGLINIPVYDPRTDTTTLTEYPASQSTLLQRQGRLGRTQGGEYFLLVNAEEENNINRPAHPTPQICQFDLSDVEFSLLRTQPHLGLDSFKQYLPDPPENAFIDAAIKRLEQLNLLDYRHNSTPKGKAVLQLRNFGPVQMCTSVYAGLTEYNCGQDMIRLAAILGVLNTDYILKSLPAKYKREQNDYMALLVLMNDIRAQPSLQDSLEFASISHYLRRALIRLQSFEHFFSTSATHLRQQAQISSKGEWPNVAKALLNGYRENVYVALKVLNGRIHQYYRYNVLEESSRKKIGTLSLGSTLDRKKPPHIVIARDIVCSTAQRELCTLSFVGSIEPDWLDNSLERKFEVTQSERDYFQSDIRTNPDFDIVAQGVDPSFDNSEITLMGSAGRVYETERFIREKLVQLRMNFQPLVTQSELQRSPNVENNVLQLSDSLHLFNPFIMRWQNEKQAVIKFKKHTDTRLCFVSIKSRDKDFEKIKEALDSFKSWLLDCAAIQDERTCGVYPQMLKQRNEEMEKRIGRVTDPDRTWDELMDDVRTGTREIRMEVVAHIAVCKFQCKLEGGFVRDWIVAHHHVHPPMNPESWVTINQDTQMPELDPNLVPADLDCHLPPDQYFDIERFLDYMYRYKIEARAFRHDPWRYVLLFDEHAPTGPFTMDLIEPHIAVTHDRLDFSVSNLYVIKWYTKALGQRIDLSAAPCSMDLDDIVNDIRNREFLVLRPKDDRLKQRIEKMELRGYTERGKPLSILPNPLGQDRMILVRLPKTSEDFKRIQRLFNEKLAGAEVLLIEQIHNPLIQKAFESMKELIATECERHDPNERMFFHGTQHKNLKSIMDGGFDDRHFSNYGLYGHGAYFADDPSKSHEYTDEQEGRTRAMLDVKVIMGNVFEINDFPDAETMITSPPSGFHSIRGTAPQRTEYVVYRNTQVLPFHKITYRHP